MERAGGWGRRGGARRLGGLALATACVGLAAGCGLLQDPSPRVLVIGDSVTRLASDEMRDEIDWADPLIVRAENGYRTDELLGEAQAALDEDPDLGVFLPGYNDVLQHRVEEAAIPEMVAVADQIDCSVWMLLPTATADEAATITRWNERVLEETAGHRSIHVSSAWRDEVDAVLGKDLLSTSDAVHPTEEGQRVLARLVEQALRESCR